MNIMETFLYDPTTDFIGKKVWLSFSNFAFGKIQRQADWLLIIQRRTHKDVPDTPEGVMESIRNKLRGLLPRQSVPLSVDGHVDELILQATDKRNLAAMYIGWCPFF